MKGLLDPKMDFVFKNIFGSEKNSKILISFLNATLKPKDLITSVEIKNTDLNKGYIEDKFSRLDVKATTSNEEIINIEIQLKNDYNMIKRSLYYWSKLYSEQLNEGEDYSILKRTIWIKVLNCKYLKTRKFRSAYRLKEIYSNEELLQQVWLNLLSNAIKFTKENGKISIQLMDTEDTATVKITDNGIGMKPESLNHIFDKFYQEDRSHSSNGNGLGLPLVKRIVDLCSGTIRVKSLLGEGSSFTVELPKNNIKIEG